VIKHASDKIDNAVAKELKGLLAHSGTHRRAEHGVECSYKWNLDECKPNLDERTELDHDIDGSEDCDDKDDCSLGNPRSRGSHIIDLHQLFLFIESNSIQHNDYIVMLRATKAFKSPLL
jgi:hypothetical protein